MSVPDLLLGLGIGLGISAAAFLIGRLYAARPRRELPSASVGPAVMKDPAGPYGASQAGGDTGAGASADDRPAASPPSNWERMGDPDDRTEPDMAPRATGLVETKTELRTSQRLLLHLARNDPVETDGTFPEAMCQKGIGEVLGLGQGAVSGLLRRLEWGGAVTSRLAHVEGHARRLKVYQLTDRGRLIVRRLYRDLGSRLGAPESWSREDDPSPAPSVESARPPSLQLSARQTRGESASRD